MHQNLYSVFDKKTDNFLPVFTLPNDRVAMRAMEQCLADHNHNFSTHPQDYSLYLIASFDSDTGTVEPDLVKLIELDHLRAEVLRRKVASVQAEMNFEGDVDA